MTDKELLKQALNALERNVQHKYPYEQDASIRLGEYAIAALNARLRQPDLEPVAPTRGELVTLIAESLSLTYHATRCWSAWRVGTMTEDDFSPVEESDTPGEIADAVLALYATPQPAPAQADFGPESDTPEKWAAVKAWSEKPAPAPWVMLNEDDVRAIGEQALYGFSTLCISVQAAFIAKQGVKND